MGDGRWGGRRNREPFDDPWPYFWLSVAIALWILTFLASRGALSAPVSPPRVYLPGYTVGDFVEYPQPIRATMDGRATVRLRGFWTKGEIVAPVEALRLVNPNARQTNRGRLVGAIALKLGIQGIPNRRYYSHPRIACAAFVSYVMRKAGSPGYPFGVNAFYARIRNRGGVLVAARVSTRYTPYYQYLRQGDLIFYHRGRRLGHLEVYVGGGKTVGTSSSALRLGVRRIGNRGFSWMSVIRV